MKGKGDFALMETAFRFSLICFYYKYYNKKSKFVKFVYNSITFEFHSNSLSYSLSLGGAKQ